MSFGTGRQLSLTRALCLLCSRSRFRGCSLFRALPPDFDVPITATFSSDSEVRGNIRVATWNIDRGYRLSNIITALQRVAPDICLLQEVDLHDRRTGNRDVGREIATVAPKELRVRHRVPGIESKRFGQARLSWPGYSFPVPYHCFTRAAFQAAVRVLESESRRSQRAFLSAPDWGPHCTRDRALDRWKAARRL